MKRFLIVGLLSAGSLQAGEPYRLFRRVLTGAACAASGFDYYTTRRAIRLGARETNGAFVSADGKFEGAKMAQFKLGLCISEVVAGELPWKAEWKPKINLAIIGVSSPQVGLFTLSGFHNLNTIKQQKIINAGREVK